LSRIEGERERVLVLAHIGLDISLGALERPLGMKREELANRIEAIIARLRQDEELTASLGDIRHLGRTGHYQALVFRLGLQDWFCSYCGQFIAQSERGAMRKTCSPTCRSRLSRAHGVGWKSQHQDSSSGGSQTGADRARPTPDADAQVEKLLELVWTIDD